MVSGRAMARPLGTSSPTTICTMVAMKMAITSDTPCTAPSPTSGSRAGSSRVATAGSASRPISREVTVIPSWAPDRLNDRCRSRPLEVLARRLPCSAA